MKIVFNCLTLEKGGAERVISTLANSLIKNNDITIITLKKGNIDYDIDRSIKIISIDNNNYHDFKKIKRIFSKLSPNRIIKLKKALVSENPDMVFSFLPEPSLRIMLIKALSKKLTNVPIIVSIRNNPKTEYQNRFIFFLMKWLYPKTDKLVLQTEEAKEYFKNIVPAEKLVVIPNPLNEKFVEEEVYTGEREKVIVTVGRLERQKNQELLIKAYKKLSETYSDYKLYIYGEGSQKQRLETIIEQLELQDKVILKGKVDNIEKVIKKAAMFVLSSDYEGMPNALMEAMALGIPCISTDCPCGGPKYLIDNQKNGILVPIGNEEAIEKAMEYMIKNPEQAKEMGKNALQIRERLNAEKICEEWNKLIEKKKKKVLFCLGSLDKGGTQRVVSNLANFFEQKNYDVGIITTKNSKPQYQLNKNISLFALDIKKKNSNIKRLKILKRIVSQYNPTVIMSFQPEPSFRILFQHKKNIPVIVSVRNDPQTEYKNKKRAIFMKWLYPKTDKLVLQTEEAKEYFKNIVPAEKLVVIPNPLNEKFVEEEVYTGEREKVIVTVGRLERQKNQELLIKAYKKLSETYSDYKLYIYGEGSQKQRLETIIEQLELQDKVILKGKVDNIEKVIKKAAMFVLSSDYEGMPNALMEAMALGIPCISTDCPCGGPKYLIDNQKNGILVPIGNEEAIEKAMEYMIKNPEQAKEMGKNALQIRERLNAEKICEEWNKLIEKKEGR